jgi:hypothetical protein
MIRANIRRKIVTSEIKAYELTLATDGQAVATEIPSFVVGGKLKDVEALRILKKRFGKHKNYQIVKITHDENVYEISVNDFLNYATKIN